MNPQLSRLVLGVEGMISDAKKRTGSQVAAPLATLEALGAFLDVGADYDFYALHYRTGLNLMQQGLSLLQSVPSPTAQLREAGSGLLQSLNPEWHPDVLERHRIQLAGVLNRILGELLAKGTQTAQQKQFSQDASKWETDFYARLAQPRTVAPTSASPKFDRESIEAYLRRRFPDQLMLRVNEVRRLSGGYGRATLLIQLSEPIFGTTEVVMRAELPFSILVLEGINITCEFPILKLAFNEGIPAPEPLILESDRDNEVGTRFILVRKAAGRNYGSAFEMTQQMSEPLLHNLVGGLVKIHNVDLRRHPREVEACHLNAWLADGTTTQAVRRWVKLWQDFLESSGTPSPVMTRALHWLLSNVPQVSDPPRLLHSDYGLGNLLIDNDRVTGVLDWEATHLGDPAEELAWLSSNLRSQIKEAEILRLYEQMGGPAVSQFRLRYFDVLTTVKMLGSGFGALARYRQNPDGDPAFCLLSTYTIEPFAKRVEEFIARAEAAA